MFLRSLQVDDEYVCAGWRGLNNYLCVVVGGVPAGGIQRWKFGLVYSKAVSWEFKSKSKIYFSDGEATSRSSNSQSR